jgi:hypothetical protein
VFNIFNEIYFKKRKLLLFFSIFLIAILSISIINIVSGANITINPNTEGGLLTAIETANKGDTIYLKNGVYTGDYNIELRLDKDLTIRGESKDVVIDGQNNYTYFFQLIKKDSANKNIPVSANLVNLKVINFKGDVVDNWGSLKVSNCVFSDNKIDGAIIGNYKGSSCKIVNSVFTRNTFNHGKKGNGVAIYADNVASLSITGSNFTNFKSTIDSVGVAVANFGSSNIVINKCNFKNTGKGATIGNNEKKGSIRVISSSFINDGTSIDNYEGSIVISKSTFKNSQSTSICNFKSMVISGSTFSKCVGYEGVITNMGNMIIKSSKFTNNSAKKYAGAISNGIRYNPGILKVVNTKFQSNIIGKTYKAIFNEKKSKITKIKVKITPKESTNVKK